MSIFFHSSFDPKRPNPDTQTAWISAHKTEGRPDVFTEVLGPGPSDVVWRYQRQPHSRVLLEAHGNSTQTIWSIYLVESASGEIVVVGNVDPEIATAFTLPKWVREWEAATLWSLELDAPLLLEGLKGNWPHHVQLVYEILPDDPEPHWLVAKVLDRKWSDLATFDNMKEVLCDEGLLITFNACHDLVWEGVRQRTEETSKGLGRAGIFGVSKGIKIVLDHEKQWALDRIKELITEALTESQLPGESGEIKTSLTKPSLFRYFEEKQ